MSAHRKYKARRDICVSVEEQEKEIAQAMGITMAEALQIGIYVLIEDRIQQEKPDPHITPELIQDYIALKNTHYAEVESYIRLKHREQQTLDKVLEMRKEAQSDEEIIEVWDTSIDDYIKIRRNQFDPEWHLFKERRRS